MPALISSTYKQLKLFTPLSISTILISARLQPTDNWYLSNLKEKYGGDIDEGYAEGAEKHAGGDGEDAATAARRYVKNARAILRTLADIYEHPSHYSFILDIPGLEASNIKVCTYFLRTHDNL